MWGSCETIRQSMSLPVLRQFTYQRRSAYPSQRSICEKKAGKDCIDSSLYPFTPNEAFLAAEPPPSLRCTGSSTRQFAYLRRSARRKRYSQLSSSSEGEEEGGKNFIPKKSHTPATIFSKLPTSKRKKRILEGGTDDTERAVGSMELTCTKETSTVYKS